MLALEQAGVDFGIAGLSGGAKQNAIPREAQVRLIVSEKDLDAAKNALAGTMAQVKNEYETTDSGLTLSVEDSGKTQMQVLQAASKQTVVMLLNNLPNGIQSMSADIEGLVETSLNMGIVALDEKEFHAEFSVRSSVESSRDSVTSFIRKLEQYAGGVLEVGGVYPAWEYKKESVLREDASRIFREMYGKEPKIEAIHAGLECGILAGKIDGLDGISIGPDMVGIHTFEEKLSISSTKRVFEFVLEVLKCKHAF